MSDVILIKGAVTYPITIDPSVWVFDERKFDLQEYDPNARKDDHKDTAYVAGAGQQWDKELREGATPPTERVSLAEERKVLTGDYAIHLAPFIQNTQPSPDATFLYLHRSEGEPVKIPFERLNDIFLQFSKDGKPIRERGPVWLYLPEMWAEGKPPIDSIEVIEVV